MTTLDCSLIRNNVLLFSKLWLGATRFKFGKVRILQIVPKNVWVRKLPPTWYLMPSEFRRVKSDGRRYAEDHLCPAPSSPSLSNLQSSGSRLWPGKHLHQKCFNSTLLAVAFVYDHTKIFLYNVFQLTALIATVSGHSHLISRSPIKIGEPYVWGRRHPSHLVSSRRLFIIQIQIHGQLTLLMWLLQVSLLAPQSSAHKITPHRDFQSHTQCPIGTRTRPNTRYFFRYPPQPDSVLKIIG